LKSIGLSSLPLVSILVSRDTLGVPQERAGRLRLGMLKLVAWHRILAGRPGAMRHFARQQALSCCAGRSASPRGQFGCCRSITQSRSILRARCEGQGRKDSRWPPAAGRRVYRDAGTASAADGQAGARELSGFFCPGGSSGLQAPRALEDQPPLGLAHDRADRRAIARGACGRSRVSDRRELPRRNRLHCLSP
jgi:hypothetical protein